MARQFSLALVMPFWLMSIPATAQAPQKPTASQSVLNGCLRQERADTTTANEKGVIYILDVASGDTPATTPPPQSSKADVARTRYSLSFEQSVDLSKHVNHHVEVTGKPLPRSPESAPPTGKPLPGAAREMFHVSSLKMLAAKCP
jgi:hypothetical protein